MLFNLRMNAQYVIDNNNIYLQLILGLKENRTSMAF